jgi:hypothetical protein
MHHPEIFWKFCLGLCWADAYFLEPVEGGPGCLLGLCRNEDIGDLTNKNGVKNKQANMGI